MSNHNQVYCHETSRPQAAEQFRNPGEWQADSSLDPSLFSGTSTSGYIAPLQASGYTVLPGFNSALQNAPAWANQVGSSLRFDQMASATENNALNTFDNDRGMQHENQCFNDGMGASAIGSMIGFATEVTWNPERPDYATSAVGVDHTNSHESTVDEQWASLSDFNRATDEEYSSCARRDAVTQYTSASEDSDQAIGTALKNGRFKCNMEYCAGKSFKRPAELRRHFNTTHATHKPEFWCDVVFCERSVAAGGRPFRRNYRLQNHVRKMHC